MVRERGGYDLMPELDYRPTNKYLPPRRRRDAASETAPLAALEPVGPPEDAFLHWVDRLFSR